MIRTYLSNEESAPGALLFGDAVRVQEPGDFRELFQGGLQVDDAGDVVAEGPIALEHRLEKVL